MPPRVIIFSVVSLMVMEYNSTCYSGKKISKFSIWNKKINIKSETKSFNFEIEKLGTGKTATGKIWWVLSDFAQNPPVDN